MWNCSSLRGKGAQGQSVNHQVHEGDKWHYYKHSFYPLYYKNSFILFQTLKYEKEKKYIWKRAGIDNTSILDGSYSVSCVTLEQGKKS